jgi:predicted nucleic acid-binding protein
MSDNIFLDTNILVYSYSNTEIVKQNIARNLISKNNVFISTQVLQELTNTITRKFKFSYDTAILTIKECCLNSNLHTNTSNTILQACRIAHNYGFTFYDSLIIAAAIECNCGILYSEDMTHNQKIFDIITIINPFV